MMPQSLQSFYRATLTPDIITPEEQQRFMDRVKQGRLLRVENPLSHTVAMLVVFDEKAQKILLVHHKKANSWIFPGGHIEEGELPNDTAIRELGEEVGLVKEDITLLGPFSAQVATVDNPRQICREHFDIFYAVKASPSQLIIDKREFFGSEWLSPKEARAKMNLKYYQRCLDSFIRFMKW